MSVAAADVNGDGYTDLVIGAGRADFGPYSSAGLASVVYGASGFGSSSFDLGALGGSNGFAFFGLSGSFELGKSVGRAAT